MATQKQSSAREQIYATGRRKTSSARVFMRPGGRGELFVNGKPLTRYFTRATAVMIAKQAIAVAQSAVTKPEVETAAAADERAGRAACACCACACARRNHRRNRRANGAGRIDRIERGDRGF